MLRQSRIAKRYALPVLLLAICALGFAGVDRWFYEVVSLRFNTLSPGDPDAYHRTKALWNLARFWPHVTGGIGCYFLIFAFARQGYRKANAALIAVFLTAIAAHLIQCGIGRARPNQSDSEWTFVSFSESGLTAHGVGFPSGEVATASALSLVVGLVFRRLRYVAWIPTILVLFARVLPGMHYISDAAAAMLLALLLTPRLYLRLIRKLRTSSLSMHRRVRPREVSDTPT